MGLSEQHNATMCSVRHANRELSRNRQVISVHCKYAIRKKNTNLNLHLFVHTRTAQDLVSGGIKQEKYSREGTGVIQN